MNHRKTQNEKQRGAALLSARIAQNSSALSAQSNVRSIWTPVNNIEYFPPNFEGLILGCIDANFCK